MKGTDHRSYILPRSDSLFVFSVGTFLLLGRCGGSGGGGKIVELISTHMVVSTQTTDGFLAFWGLTMKSSPPPETQNV